MQEIANNTELTAPFKPQTNEALPRKLLPWAIWAIATGFVVFQFLLQMSSGPMIDPLMVTFSITAFGAGILSSTYYYVYVLMQIPAGMLMDHYGARCLLSIGGAVCTVGCLLFAVTSNLYLAELGRVLMGGGSAFAFIGALFLIGRWFPASRFALLMGMSDMVGSLGSLLGNVTLAKSIEAYTWRESMFFAAFMALVLTLLNILVVRDSPKGQLTARAPFQWQALRSQVTQILQDRTLWMHGLYVGILFAVITVFSGLWGIPFLRLQDGISNTMATFVASLAFAGLGVGCPIMGWLFPRIQRPRMMLSACATVAAIVTFAVIYLPIQNVWIHGALMVILGASSSVYVFNFALIQKITRPDVRNTANGFINTLCVITVPIFQPLIGYILDHAANPVVNGPETYSIANYHWALSVIPLALLLAAVIARLIPKAEVA